jgi:hypothetical protein
MQKQTFWLLLAAVCSASACSSRDSNLETSVNVVGVAQLGADLAYVQSDGVVQRLNVLATDPKPVTSKVPTTSAPRLVVKRPSASLTSPIDELLVVGDGESDQYGQIVEAPALTALASDGGKRVYPLVDPGQQMRISDDGRFAILFVDPTYTDKTSLLTNPAEIAIVDLQAARQDKTNPTIRNIDTVGGPPNAVWFPELTVGTVSHWYAFFTFPDGASLIDLANPTEQGHKIPLTDWLSAGGISSADGFAIAADPSGNEIYLKSNSSKNVEVVTVMPSATVTGDVDVSLKQLSVGSVAPGAISVYSNTSGTQLVATLGNAVALVDTSEDSVTTVALSHLASQILMFQGASPEDTGIKQRALLFASNSTKATFADLESFVSDPERALHPVEFGESISTIRQVDFLPGYVLVFLSSGGVDILDLTTRHWVPIDSPVALTLVEADKERSRVWVSAPGDKRIAYLDFGTSTDRATLTINNRVQLDDPVQSFFRMGTAGNARIVVTHSQAGGAVTLLDAVDPQRTTAKKLEGFLFSDLL